MNVDEMRVKCAEETLAHERDALLPYPRTTIGGDNKPVLVCPACGNLVKDVRYREGVTPGWRKPSTNTDYFMFASLLPLGPPKAEAKNDDGLVFNEGRVERLDWTCKCGYVAKTLKRTF